MKLAQEIKAIHERNRRVEADKAWETSAFRRLLIAAATYGMAFLLMLQLQLPNPALNALIPATAYAVSTLSLPFIKRWWIENSYQTYEMKLVARKLRQEQAEMKMKGIKYLTKEEALKPYRKYKVMP